MAILPSALHYYNYFPEEYSSGLCQLIAAVIFKRNEGDRHTQRRFLIIHLKQRQIPSLWIYHDATYCGTLLRLLRCSDYDLDKRKWDCQGSPIIDNDNLYSSHWASKHNWPFSVWMEYTCHISSEEFFSFCPLWYYLFSPVIFFSKFHYRRCHDNYNATVATAMVYERKPESAYRNWYLNSHSFTDKHK